VADQVLTPASRAIRTTSPGVSLLRPCTGIEPVLHSPVSRSPLGSRRSIVSPDVIEFTGGLSRDSHSGNGTGTRHTQRDTAPTCCCGMIKGASSRPFQLKKRASSP